MEPDFLTVEDALYIHRNQVETFGGEHGVRDLALLESALAQPRATFTGTYLHTGLFDMAAAYLYHVVQNHPFLDGNKRTGVVLALTFLDWNGVVVFPDNDGLVAITVRVASGDADKSQVSEFLRSITHD